MKLYTKKYLLDLVSQKDIMDELSDYSTHLREKKKYDIFLSHNPQDKDYIYGLYYELAKRGFIVYLDWVVDSHIRRLNVSKGIMGHITTRLKQSNSYIYASANHSEHDHWMSWEMGYMYSQNEHCAVLPIASFDEEQYWGKDFMSTYPVVQRGEFNNSELEILVCETSHSYKTLKEWVSH